MSSIGAIQTEYFEMLQNTQLVKNTGMVDVEGKTAITANQELINKYLQMVKTSAHGNVSGIFSFIEEFYDDVYRFWGKRAQELKDLLNATECSYVHVPHLGVSKNIKKYGLLFDGILVSDQIMESRAEYLAADSPPNWQKLLGQVVSISHGFLEMRNELELHDGSLRAVILPPTHCMNSKVSASLIDAINAPTVTFFSALCDQNFSNMQELYSTAMLGKFSEERLNPKLLDLLFERDGAKSIPEYIRSVGSALHNEQGNDWTAAETHFATTLFDVAARFREFERYALDAYDVGQEPEIPQHDFSLYEWWFEKTSIASGNALGSSYSDKFLFKSAPISSKMGFQNEVPLDFALEIQRQTNSVDLREELSFARSSIKRAPTVNLSQVVEESGHAISSKLDEFAASISRNTDGRKRLAVTSGKIFYSASLSVLSTVFPPLSALGLVWGGSLSDVIKLRKDEKAKLAAEMKRPIASMLKIREKSRVSAEEN